MPNCLIGSIILPNKIVFAKQKQCICQTKNVCQTKIIFAKQNKCLPNKVSICQTICVFPKSLSNCLAFNMTRSNYLSNCLNFFPGVCGAGCAALRGPFAKSRVLVSRLTCISSVPLIAFTRRSDTPSASRVALCPPRTRWEGTSKEPTRPATTGARALRESEWQWQRARGMRTVPPQVRTGRPSSVGKVEFLLIATSRSVQNRVPRIRS